MPEPRQRFGDPYLEVVMALPAWAGAQGFTVCAFCALSDLQVEPYRGHVWLLLWPILLGLAAGAVRGDATARRAVCAWALGTVVLRGLEREWMLVVVHLAIAWYAWVAHSGPRPGGAWRMRWVMAGALLGVLNPCLEQAVGAVRPIPVERLPRVAPRPAVYPPAGDPAWVGTGVQLVPRGERLVLEGAEWVRGQEVAFVPLQDALVIGDTVFRRAPDDSSGEGKLVVGGGRFVRRWGRIRGEVMVLRTEDALLITAFLRVDYRRRAHVVVLPRPER